MDISQFLNNVAAGNASQAKETLTDILSARAFESIDDRKKELAQTLFGGRTEEIEVQDTADTPVEEELLTQEEFDTLSEEDQEMYLESLEQLDEVSSYTKVGKLVRKFIPGQGQKQAGERAKDQGYSAGLDRAALQYHPNDKTLATSMKSSEKAQQRYKKISQGKSPFAKEDVDLDEVSKTTLRNYLKGSRAENQGSLGSAGHMSDKARSLGRTEQDKEDGRYEGQKLAKRKLGAPGTIASKVMAK